MVGYILLGICALVGFCSDMYEAIDSFKKGKRSRGIISLILAALMLIIFIMCIHTFISGSWDIHFHFKHSGTRVIQ